MLRADLALVQEALPPHDVQALDVREVRPGRRWGTSIASLGPPLRAHELGDPLPAGAVAAATAKTPDGAPLLVVSVYGIEWRASYPATLASILESIAPALRTAARMPINVTTQLDKGKRQPNRDALTMIAEMGFVPLLRRGRLGRARLVDCGCPEKHDCDHVQTHRWLRRADRPFQLDHFFVNDVALRGITGCELYDADDAWELSDHCPFVVTWEPAETSGDGR